MRLPRLRRDRRTSMRKVLKLPFTIHIVLWLLLGVSVAVGAAWALWLLVGQPSLSGAKGPASTQDKFDGLKIALTVVGGIGGVIALTVAYRKQRLGEAAEQREDTKVFTDRFTKASELLGSDQAAVRLAGVYAMAALADDWDAHRQTCIDVLCAYLRMPYIPPVTLPQRVRRPLGLRKTARRPDHSNISASPALSPSIESAREEQQVRHTIVRVITAHLRSTAQISWHGHSFDFTGATFDGGDFGKIAVRPGTTMSFQNAVVLHGQVDFGGADLSGGTVDFRGAEFSGGTVNFSWAEFTGGTVDFREAGFTGGTVTFSETKFTGGTVDFRAAKFTGGTVTFSGAEFTGGTVAFRLAKFTGGTVDFLWAKFTGGTVNFSEAEFTGGTVDFRAAEFTGGTVAFRLAKFTGGTVDFLWAEFTGGTVTFSEAEFTGGTVDLSYPASYEIAPLFNAWPNGVPPGLLLPNEHDVDAISDQPPSVTAS